MTRELGELGGNEKMENMKKKNNVKNEEKERKKRLLMKKKLVKIQTKNDYRIKTLNDLK